MLQLYGSLCIFISMENLNVTLIQTDLHWEDKAANLALFDKKLSQLHQPTDLILLPEMFTTGFSMDAPALAETMSGKTLHWLQEKAAAFNAVITGTCIIEEAGLYFNRLIWMRPDGSFETYDKRHLFALAKEHHTYTAGNQQLLVDLKGWKIMPLICYDLRFPVWSRNAAGYDLLLYLANFPERRNHAWKSLLIARAIENQAYTIGLNRVGTDGKEVYHAGDSAVIDYAGQVLYQCSHIENMYTAALSYTKQQAFREQFAFLNDRDDFEIIFS